MFKIIPFKKEHIIPLLDQPINLHVKDLFLGGLAEKMEADGASTGFYNDEVMVCGGVSIIWPGRGILWTVFNEKSKQCFVPVLWGIRKWVDEYPLRRIEMSVPTGNENARRRALLLGFELEAEFMRSFLPNGGDCSLFSKVKHVQ
jgi:hypothetical protein